MFILLWLFMQSAKAKNQSRDASSPISHHGTEHVPVLSWAALRRQLRWSALWRGISIARAFFYHCFVLNCTQDLGIPWHAEFACRSWRQRCDENAARFGFCPEDGHSVFNALKDRPRSDMSFRHFRTSSIPHGWHWLVKDTQEPKNPRLVGPTSLRHRRGAAHHKLIMISSNDSSPDYKHELYSSPTAPK